MTATLEKQVHFLKLYAVFLTTAVGVVSLAAFRSGNEKPHFAEIDVERINVVEKDGKVRMVITNKEREDVVVVQTIGARHHPLVPAIITGFISAQKQDGGAAGIERIQHTVLRAPRVLDA